MDSQNLCKYEDRSKHPPSHITKDWHLNIFVVVFVHVWHIVRGSTLCVYSAFINLNAVLVFGFQVAPCTQCTVTPLGRTPGH